MCCAYENTARNCGANNVRYARIPTGDETCEFCVMLASRQADGYLRVNDARYDIIGRVITPGSCTITMDGAAYVRDNSGMARVRTFLGKAFEKTLEAAIQMTP